MSILKRAAEAIKQSNESIQISSAMAPFNIKGGKNDSSSMELKSIQMDVSVIRQIMEKRFESIAESIKPESVKGKGDKAEAALEEKKNLSKTQKTLLQLQKSMGEFGNTLKGLGDKLTPKGTFGEILGKIAKGVLLIGMFKAFKYLAENWDSVKEKLAKFNEEYWPKIKKVFEFLYENFWVIAGLVGGALLLGPIIGIAGTIMTIGSGLAAVASALVPIISFITPLLVPIGIIAGIAYSLWTGFSDASEEFEKTGSYVDAALAGISGFFSAIPDLLTDMLGWLAGAFGFEETEKTLKEFSWKDTFKEGFAGLQEWMDGLFADPGTALEDLTKNLFGGFADIGDFIWNKGIKPAIDMILMAFGFNMELPESNLGNIVRDNIRIVFDWLGDLFSGDKTLEALNTLWTNAIGGFADIADWFGNSVINPIIETVLGLFGVDVDLGDWNLGIMARNAVNSVFEWIETVFANPLGYIEKLWNDFLDGADNLATWVYDSAIQPIVDWFTGTFAKIAEMLPTGEDIKRLATDSVRALPGGGAVLKLMGISSDEEIADQNIRNQRDFDQTNAIQTMSSEDLRATIERTQYAMSVGAAVQGQIDTMNIYKKELSRRALLNVTPTSDSRADDMNDMSKNQTGSNSGGGVAVYQAGDTFNQGGNMEIIMGNTIVPAGTDSINANGPYQ